MLLTRRAPDHVAGADFFDWASPALNQAAASRDDQGLTQRVRVPRRPGAGLEGDADAERPRRLGWLGAASLDVHTASFLYPFFDASRWTSAATMCVTVSQALWIPMSSKPSAAADDPTMT